MQTLECLEVFIFFFFLEVFILTAGTESCIHAELTGLTLGR